MKIKVREKKNRFELNKVNGVNIVTNTHTKSDNEMRGEED
jgi:hypothetical protein